LAKGDRGKVRWAKDRQRKKVAREKRQAEERGKARKGRA
jgi:hypothetical protein